MADFSDPKYESYRNLCADLGYERPCRYCYGKGTDPWAESVIAGRLPQCPRCEGRKFDYPTLADWLEMLEAASVPLVGFQVSEDGARFAAFRLEVESVFHHQMTSVEVGTGASREEAAARLWMAVRS